MAGAAGIRFTAREPLARETGLEPATSGVTGRRSNQLSYTRSSEVPGFKAAGPARQAGTAANSCPRNGMGGDGFEPPALSV